MPSNERAAEMRGAESLLGSYFERIGYRGPATPTVGTLQDVSWLHQLAIPFENLDIVHFRRPISLTPEAIYDKLVSGRRGGFCFEQNGLLAMMLEALGFGVTMGYATWQPEGGERVVPFDHIVLAVNVPGESVLWLADVGFGGDTPAGPLPLDQGAVYRQPRSGIAYQVEPLEQPDLQWRVSIRPEDDEPRTLYDLDLRPRRMEDFEHRSQYNQTSPESHFTQSLICSKRTPGGRITVTGDLLIQTVDGQREETPLTNERERANALATWFGIQTEEPA